MQPSTSCKKSFYPWPTLALIAMLLLLQGCTGSPAPDAATDLPPATATESTGLTTTAVEPTLAPTGNATSTRTPLAATITSTPAAATPVVVITPDSQVRRLSSAVFSGAAQPLSELNSDAVVTLDPGSLLTTDQNGEAEVVIAGCLKLFVFQAVSLTRSTCRKEDAASGLAVCSTAGMVGVLNRCVSQVDVQTPSSDVQTHGTWFTVIYLPDDQLSIVQVYEGEVGVQGVVDPRTNESTQASSLGEGSMWFSAPGEEAPSIAGIPGRTAQPIEVWQAVRPELIGKYPQLDNWMAAAEERANAEQLPFPDFLSPAQGVMTLNMVGPYWSSRSAMGAFLQGVNWPQVMQSVLPEANVSVQVKFSDTTIDDARLQTYDYSKARSQYEASGFDPNSNLISIITHEGNYLENAYASGIQSYLQELGYPTELLAFNDTDLEAAIKNSSEGVSAPLIWFTLTGPAFDGF